MPLNGVPSKSIRDCYSRTRYTLERIKALALNRRNQGSVSRFDRRLSEFWSFGPLALSWNWDHCLGVSSGSTFGPWTGSDLRTSPRHRILSLSPLRQCTHRTIRRLQHHTITFEKWFLVTCRLLTGSEETGVLALSFWLAHTSCLRANI